MKVMQVAVAITTLFLNLIPTYQPAVALNVNVKCRSPEPGVYTLGWGTCRLIIPKDGRPYYAFRGQNKMV
jgi:hypothetical protein